MEKADLTGANLEGIHADGTTVWPKAMANVRLTGSDLRWITMSGTRLNGVDFTGTDLSEADLSDIDAACEPPGERAVFREATLVRVHFGLADLRGADFTGADLTGACLQEANLQDAILVGASLRGADLRGADLWRATLDQANLEGARVDNTTRWPEGFKQLPTEAGEEG